MTALQATDRLRERTVATTAYSRTLVGFDFVVPEIVKSAQRAMRMGNATGPQIYLYPGFLMMRDASTDFALIEYQELKASFSESQFIESQTVPSDTQVVGQTWKKANKDGSPDRRFKDNYSIPVVRYAEMLFESPAGLREAYQFSDFEKTSAFHKSLSNHQRALIELAKADGASAPAAEASEREDEPEELEMHAVAPTIKPEKFVLDWIALGMGVLAVGLGSNWGLHHRVEIGHRLSAAFQPAAVAPTPVAAPAPATPPPKHPRKHHKRAAHHTATPSGGAT